MLHLGVSHFFFSLLTTNLSNFLTPHQFLDRVFPNIPRETKAQLGLEASGVRPSLKEQFLILRRRRRRR